MALFSRTNFPAELRSLIGRDRVLARAEGVEGPVAGLAGRLLFKSGGVWVEQPWHLINRGGWDQPSRTLSWLDADGEPWTLELAAAGALTDLFDERVTNSIALTQRLELAGGRIAIITARRDLGDRSSGLVWRVVSEAGNPASDLAGEAQVQDALARLRAEYDLG